MSNERNSIFETFTVQGDNSENQTLDDFFQVSQTISTPHFYPQQDNATYIIQSSTMPQQQFIQHEDLQPQNPYIVQQQQKQQQQEPMFEQYIPQQQQFPAQQQVTLIQQQLNQQKQNYQQKKQLQQQLQFQQQQQLPFNQVVSDDLVSIGNDDSSNVNNTIFLNGTTPLHNNNSNQNNNINDDSSTIVPNIVVNNNNNYYDNSCNDFTGVEEVVEELWMSCESHGSPIFKEVNNNEQQLYEFVDPDDMLPKQLQESTEEKKKKKKKKRNLPTCYSLFFRDTQLAIKEQRPDASLHEVTSIVDSMWKQLEPKHRAYYEKLAKVEKSKHKRLFKKEEDRVGKVKEGKVKEGKVKEGKASNKKHKQPKQEEEKSVGHVVCKREGCSLRAIDDVRWNKDYCSTQCVVNHCKEVFKAWVLSKKAEADNEEKKL